LKNINPKIWHFFLFLKRHTRGERISANDAAHRRSLPVADFLHGSDHFQLPTFAGVRLPGDALFVLFPKTAKSGTTEPRENVCDKEGWFHRKI
jgi:hypothetical protein